MSMTSVVRIYYNVTSLKRDLLILQGEYIDAKICVALGLSTMAGKMGNDHLIKTTCGKCCY